MSGLEAADREALGPDHPEVALWEIKLGFHWSERRRYDQTPSGCCGTLPKCSRESVTTTPVRRCAPRLRRDGPRAGADRAYDQFVEAERLFRAALGDEGPLQHAARLSQGWALVKARRYAEAKPLLERLAAEMEKVTGPQSLPLLRAQR